MLDVVSNAVAGSFTYYTYTIYFYPLSYIPKVLVIRFALLIMIIFFITSI